MTVRERFEELRRIKGEIYALDQGNVHEFIAPEPPATERQVAEVEAYLGFALHPDFREFLLIANGWCRVISGTDLFGTKQLLHNESAAEWATFMFSEFEEALGNVTLSEIIPIGHGREADIFFMGKPASSAEGQFFWRHEYGFNVDNGFEAFLKRLASAESEYKNALSSAIDKRRR